MITKEHSLGNLGLGQCPKECSERQKWIQEWIFASCQESIPMILQRGPEASAFAWKVSMKVFENRSILNLFQRNRANILSGSSWIWICEFHSLEFSCFFEINLLQTGRNSLERIYSLDFLHKEQTHSIKRQLIWSLCLLFEFKIKTIF